MNKRVACEQLYAELRAEDYILPEGKSIRSVFLERAVMEVGMTEKGAGTYYINAKTKYEGGAVPSYYKSNIGSPPAGQPDTRWSVLLVVDSKVAECHVFETEEKAWTMYNKLRPENQSRCVVVPGTAAIGEATA